MVGAPLKPRQVETPSYSETTDSHLSQVEEVTDIDALLDAKSELLDTSGPGAEQSEIDIDVDILVFAKFYARLRLVTTSPLKNSNESRTLLPSLPMCLHCP